MANKSKPSNFGLKGVGAQVEKHLARLQIYSPHDLLLHLPFRYQDRTQVQSIRQLIPGNEALVEGVIQSVESPVRGRTKLLCQLSDGTRLLTLRFFHVLPFQKEILKVGARLRCYQEVKLGQKGLEMTHPEFQVISSEKSIPVNQTLTPVYPATEGLGQYTLRKLVTNAMMHAETELFFQELLPSSILQSLSFPTLKEALKFVHQPPSTTSMQLLMENKTLPQQRLAFEELLAHRISLLQVKHTFQSQPGIPFITSEKLTSAFLQTLSFQLTKAQQRVVNEIKQDLMKSQPMLRLVQGDVGSGKTVVAALAMLQAIENGYQAVLMAPTELLAEQHYRVFKKWLEPLGLKVVFLSGSVKASIRKTVLEEMANGEAQIIIGTHALFQDKVTFSKLALVVIDEQHRFGVHQRASLLKKGMQDERYPHQLVMTATPIPRTLSMSFYADLDCSVIDELPPGRTPIMTSVIAASRRDEIVVRVREACEQGKQVYWVCPLIEESEVLTCQAATQTAEQLQIMMPHLKVGLIHGRMKAAEKDAAMKAFQAGETHLLVATTVIEVGVDVPNASVMVIENSERLGLSQLHQLRGRVGRGSVASHCLLLYQYPISSVGKERLSVMRETTDGFKIAQRDLELRGPGEVLGTRQTGDLSFRVADLMRDASLLTTIQQTADVIIHQHPEIIEPLIKRWLAKGYEYGKV